MKFNFGHWALMPGVQAVHPRWVADVRAEGGALTVTGYDRPIRSRGDTVDGAVITTRFTSPMPNVIRVQHAHFQGRRARLPVFDLDYTLSDPSAAAGADGERAWLKTGGLTVEVPTTGEWRFAVRRGGEILTASEPRAAGLFACGGETYFREQLALEPDETVYGLGERFGPLAKNGQSAEIWNEDGGTDSEWAYKNIPFYLTSRGCGVLVNHPGRVSFEVASHHTGRVQFSAAGHGLEYYLFGGPSPKDVLEQYTALSGRPALPPEWSFGLWLSSSFTTDYDEKTILANLERMEREGIPVGVFHFDCFWMREFTWSSLEWDRRSFPDPDGMIRRIHAKGAKVCLWINPYIAEASPLFAEGAAQGYLLRNRAGDVYQDDRWQPGMGYVDFTHPAACAWYAGKLKALTDLGVDAFKTDFGERIPADAVYHDGSDPERMHNYYAYLYNRTVFDLLRREKGEGEAVVFARSAACGSQKFPLHWGGDNSSTFASMAETLRGGLSFGLSGFGFWSHDIGGFTDTATPDLYKRWVAFGMLSSHSRLHGNDSPRVPWAFDDEAVAVLRHFHRLKTALLPYLLDAAREASAHGWPVLRAMVLEFPGDPACRHLEMQYMLGSALLVAPVFRADGQVTYYLPAGEWRSLLDGRTATGPGWRTEQMDYFHLPLWVHAERGRQWDCLRKFSFPNKRAGGGAGVD